MTARRMYNFVLCDCSLCVEHQYRTAIAAAPIEDAVVPSEEVAETVVALIVLVLSGVKYVERVASDDHLFLTEECFGVLFFCAWRLLQSVVLVGLGCGRMHTYYFCS